MRRALALGLALALICACSRANPPAKKGNLPGPEAANERAPERFRARFSTSKGDFVVDVHRDWAPNGADRFYNLVKIGFYDEARFFRVVPGFVTQWGLHADGDSVMSSWRDAKLKDDPVKESNRTGRITFAMAGPDSRTTQVFINTADNARLDASGFAPFGEVTEGMNVVLSFDQSAGQRPDQMRIQMQGNAYLKREFPALDWVKTATIVP